MIITRFLAICVLCILAKLYCHPPASSSDREKLKYARLSCYFGLKRSSTAEIHERVQPTAVSTSCGKKLRKMGELLGPTKRELYGSSSSLEISLNRGASFYPKTEKDLKPFTELLICDEHEKELLSEWSKSQYNHVKRKMQDGQLHQQCSFPLFAESDDEPDDEALDNKGFAHDYFAKVGDSHTKYVTRDQAKIFTEATGYHIHVGTPVCAEHHQKIIAIIDEHTKLDQDWIMAEEQSMESATTTLSPVDLISRAVHSLADAFGLTAFMPTNPKPFTEYAKDTQRKKADMGYKMYRSVLTGIAPGHEDSLHAMIEKRFHPRNWDRYAENSADDVIRVVADQYLLAPNMQMRDYTLALLAGKFTYGSLLRHLPSLSIYKYQKARSIAFSGRFLRPIVDHGKKRYDDEGLNELITFITSPLVLVGQAFGERTVYTSKGIEMKIPNTIRMMSQTEIVRQFKAYMIAQGKEKHLLSDSTIIRILNAIPATRRHPMTCVDSYLAKSYYSFDDLLKIIDKLHEIDIIDKTAQAAWRNDVLQVQLYLRSDFKLHAKMESLIGDHCLTFALSDAEDAAFRKQEGHQHKEQCSRCAHMFITFRELLKIIADALETASSDKVKNDLKEMHFKVKSHRDVIERLRNHEIRAAFTRLERDRIISSLEERHCLLTGDFAMKWLPHYYWEEQKQFYGKAGRSWHVFHSLCRLEGQFVQHAFVHLITSGAQDSVAVTNILLHTATLLKKVGIVKLHVRSDNAANYHSSGTLGSIPEIMEKSGMDIASWSFSERQDGKSSSDRENARCKGKMRRYFQECHNVYSTHDMFLALSDGFDLRGVSTYEIQIVPPTQAETNDWKLKGIADMGHFEFETGSEGKVTMRYWKYNGIGKGKTVTDMKANGGKLVEINSSSRMLAEKLNVADELSRLRNNQEGQFWRNDVGRNSVEEPYDADDEPEEEEAAAPPPKKSQPPDHLNYCWCGSAFIRFQNLLNHMEWGTHSICPEAVSLTDNSIFAFKRKVEDMKPASSLLPLADSVGSSTDESVPLLTEGFALSARAYGGRLPESSRSFLVKYFEDEKALGHRPDAEEGMNKQNLAAEVPFEDRLTIEQINSLFSRLSKTKKSKVKRSTDGTHEEEDDDDVDPYVRGEWEDFECGQPLNPEEAPDFVLYKYIHEHLDEFFDTSHIVKCDPYPNMTPYD